MKEGIPTFIPLLNVIFPLFNERKREFSREGVRETREFEMECGWRMGIVC